MYVSILYNLLVSAMSLPLPIGYRERAVFMSVCITLVTTQHHKHSLIIPACYWKISRDVRRQTESGESTGLTTGLMTQDVRPSWGAELKANRMDEELGLRPPDRRARAGLTP
ncbi:hypothetical protein B0H17DRAFT_293254 [Mycena rosella]|uniref:Uncharacterized protein n=1 Tax=Mycena rosella TaxID=1033263 RepID=A0AAD7CW80_MYCRO|nr:hypothetical protein B0H17DRAFT_293254 [Mycena rosella]